MNERSHSSARSFGTEQSLIRVLLLWLGVCLLGAFGGTEFDDARVTEYQLKAAFLRNFALFTSWPNDCFADEQSPFIVGVVGEDPFGKVLDLTFKDQFIGGHPFTVRRFERAADIETCHLLFVPSTEMKNAVALKKAIAGRSMLVVGESEDFARKVGVVGFVVEKTKLRFAINPSAAERARLRISSKLLDLAHIVGDTSPQREEKL